MSDRSKEFTKLAPGTRLRDRYVIDGEIGKGGFATVYSARDEVIDRTVAIKVLQIASLGSDREDKERARKRFLREARVAARISHRSVVDIYDFGILDDKGSPFIIMEFLQGENLYNQIYGTGPLAPEWILPNYCDVLDALGEAHQENIVHKDLKPGNIFINLPGTRREVWKVVDFGIAHVNSASNARLTKTGFLSGTPQYLPPEYIQAQTVSPQMDVYQMALTLAEALTGVPAVSERKPFKAAMKHVEGDLDIPEKLWNSPIGIVLTKALAADPKQRFADGMEFADALAKVDPRGVPSFAEEEEDDDFHTRKTSKIDAGDVPKFHEH